MSICKFQAIILAAGKGSRMGSDIPKVLIPICGRPMITIILDSLAELGIEKPVVVIGKNGQAIMDVLGDNCIYAFQDEQLGSGHAVKCAREEASDAEHLVIMCGDSPLFKTATVDLLMKVHIRDQAAVTLVSAILDDPGGYGRIIRDSDGQICGVVEEKIADGEQKRIMEINGGCYAFDAEWLWANIDLMRKNEAGEYCLTEMVDIAVSQGKRVSAVSAGSDEVAGVNTPVQLAEAEEILKSRSGCV
ncbi:MAG: NTP transferase domain-containing protein [Armatimonadota bacterium]